MAEGIGVRKQAPGLRTPFPPFQDALGTPGRRRMLLHIGAPRLSAAQWARGRVGTWALIGPAGTSAPVCLSVCPSAAPSLELLFKQK